MDADRAEIETEVPEDETEIHVADALGLYFTQNWRTEWTARPTHTSDGGRAADRHRFASIFLNRTCFSDL